MNPKVNFYFSKNQPWQEELEHLRQIVLDCGLTEELKWGCPCYTYQGRNIVLLHVFKEYCAILFFKGALLPDPEQILIRQTERVQAARQVRFTGVPEILPLAATLKAYIIKAVEVEKAGLKVELKQTRDFPVAAELQIKLDEIPALQSAFQALTPGRQRAYHLYFTAPKQSSTREARVAKYVPHILQGKGLHN